MDRLTLLARATAAGLTVTADGDRLVIRGPKGADAIARDLIAQKPAVLAALAAEPPEAVAVWWDDRGTAAPVRHLPPRGCLAPRVCSRIGPCERRDAGRPCLVGEGAAP